jgi:membrane-bound lytic murein transglycosylase B
VAYLQAQAEPVDLLGVLRHDLQLEVARYAYRDAVRNQQVVVYALAVDQGLEAQVAILLPAAELPPLRQTTEALRALWRAAGISDFNEVRIRNNRRFQDSAPLAQMAGYYRTSGGHYAIDWTYLASINFIESDFGRVNGPSSAGALGPMQFMPGTWNDYGNGGDIMSPKDSIEAAARYLHAMGGPGNMDRAIYRYNNDSDYVASVKGFAAALREDGSWLDRLYFWSTSG